LLLSFSSADVICDYLSFKIKEISFISRYVLFDLVIELEQGERLLFCKEKEYKVFINKKEKRILLLILF